MQVLWLTEPETWSPHATYQATRLFISNLNARLAQRFLSLVLLPHVRQDIREHQRLHFALFQALKKAAYKPDAFYKARRHPWCCPVGCSESRFFAVSEHASKEDILVVSHQTC